MDIHINNRVIQSGKVREMLWDIPMCLHMKG